jgi:hypothetical protein
VCRESVLSKASSAAWDVLQSDEGIGKEITEKVSAARSVSDRDGEREREREREREKKGCLREQNDSGSTALL